MNARVRVASERDYKQLCGLWAQLDQFHAEIQPAFFRCPPGLRPGADLRAALQDEQRDILVANTPTPDKRLIGALQLHLYDVSHQPMMRPARRAYVEDLVVDEAFRGRGVGHRLMEAAEAWAERRGANQVVLTVWQENDRAFDFYDEIGYRPINRVLVRTID